MISGATTLDADMVSLPVGNDFVEMLDQGSGPPIVLVHGALADARLWRPHCERLSRRRRCVAPTLRGFGLTLPRADGPTFGAETHAADLIALLTTLRLGPADVVGWSYGACPLLLAALQRPDLFRRLLIYEPGYPTWVEDPDELAAFTADAERVFGPVAEAVQAGDLEGAVRRLIDGSEGREGAFDDQSQTSRDLQMQNAHTLPLQLAQATPPPITGGDLRALPIPLRVVWGEHTRSLFSIPSRAAAACLPRGAGFVVPGAGHLWVDSDPSGFASLIEAWLETGESS